MRIESGNTNRIQRIKRVQRAAEIKDSTYYTRRLLTKEDQTGEISGNLRSTERTSNLSIREIYEMQSSRNQSSIIYNKLQEQNKENKAQTEQDRVREFKSGYKSEVNNNIRKETQNEEIEKEENER